MVKPSTKEVNIGHVTSQVCLAESAMRSSQNSESEKSK